MTATPTRPAATPEQFVAGYGPTWRQGVISEHLDAFEAAGGVVRPAASGTGAQWAVVDRKAYPVLCSEVVAIRTEDGLISGRCGNRATTEGACAGHAEQIAYFRAQSEAETIAWERDRAGLPAVHLV